MNTMDRNSFLFEEKVKEVFDFLLEKEFLVVESKPTFVLYKKKNVEVILYHGRKSYEIGAEISISEVQYSISEIIRAVDSEVAKNYLNFVAMTPESVSVGLVRVASLMRRYGDKLLHADPQFLRLLENKRQQWSEDYALDVLYKKLCPEADEAFRQGSYLMAFELYKKIQNHLSPAELKKMQLAEERSRK